MGNTKTSFNDIKDINDINDIIETFYEHIKSSWKIDTSFKLDEFIKRVRNFLESNGNNPPNDVVEGINPPNEETDITFRIVYLKRNIGIIQKDIEQINYKFENKQEILLIFKASDTLEENEADLRIALNLKIKWYYFAALKRLLILRKNEITLLDENISLHHRNKSKFEIKEVNEELKIAIKHYEKSIKTKWKEVLEEVLDYWEFLLFKFNSLDKKYSCTDKKYSCTDKDSDKDSDKDKYRDYKKIIDFDNKCNEYEIHNECSDEDAKRVIKKIKEIYQDIIWKDKFDSISNSNEIFKVDNDKELYLFFRYIKDIKYRDNNIKAYEKLKSTLKEYLKRKTETKSYINWNIVYFINNLISLLNKSIEKSKDNKYQDFDYVKEKEYLNQIFKDKELDETYFTYFKNAQLYKNLWNLKNKQDYLIDAWNEIDKSITFFPKNNLAYYPFTATSELIKSEWFFSYTTFLVPQKTDYYLKIKREQISILESKSEYIIEEKVKVIDDKIKNNEKVIDDKLHNSNIKAIEILAVFSAIILFVSSCVQVFQYLPDVSSIIYVMLWFWFSIIWFISILFFIIWEKKDYYKYWFVYWFIFLIFISFIVISINIKNDNVLINKEYKEDIKNSIINDLKDTNIINSVFENDIENKMKEYSEGFNIQIKNLQNENTNLDNKFNILNLNKSNN